MPVSRLFPFNPYDTRKSDIHLLLSGYSVSNRGICSQMAFTSTSGLHAMISSSCT